MVVLKVGRKSQIEEYVMVREKHVIWAPLTEMGKSGEVVLQILNWTVLVVFHTGGDFLRALGPTDL